jgi:predicted PurR-regulated permease PerM
MVLVTASWRMWLIGLAASLAIFGVVYFTVIKPDQNTANQALKSGLQQTQQAINQAQKQLSTTGGQASSVVSQATKQAGAANSQAQKTLNNVSKLATCVSAAGTDAAKLSECQVKFGS